MKIGERFNPYRRFHGAFVPEAICKYRGLSPGAKLAYGRLCRYAGEDGKVYPAAATLAKEIGISERQVQAYIKELERGKFIDVDRQNKHYQKDGGGGTNTVFFLWHAAYEGYQGTPRKAPPLRQFSALVRSQETAAPTPAVNCGQSESISVRESVKKSQVKADSRATPRKTANPSRQQTCPTNPNGEKDKADPPARTAGEEKHLPVEKQKSEADSAPKDKEQISQLTFRPWNSTEIDQVRKLLSAFMDREEPPNRLVVWIHETFEGICPARDVHAALEVAWNRNAAPGQKNAPRTWNWFYSTLRNALIEGEAARMSEQPAAPRPEHTAGGEAMNCGIDALEQADARLIAWRKNTDD